MANDKALAAVTAEDMDFERALQMAEATAPDIEPAPASAILKKERTVNIPLAEFVDDYAPAKDGADLMHQVHMALMHGADSIEATPDLIKTYTHKSGYPTDVGYFWFHNVKVWIPGYLASHGYMDTESIDAKVFGKSTLAISPIMDGRDKK